MYKQELQTNNKSKWINTREFIIVHHTGTKQGTIKWVLRTITVWNVSCHYVVDFNWDKYKIWSTNDILWHCWVSEWKEIKSMNFYSIWIEVIWWKWEEFPREQRVAVRELIQHLMKTFNIPKENVLRHADLTWDWSSEWILWDWKSKSRKTDISNLFWNHWFKNWKEYQESL